MPKFSLREKKQGLEKFLVDTSLVQLGENLHSIYSYGSSNGEDNEFSDIDIMMVLKKFPKNTHRIESIQYMTNLLNDKFNESEIPLDFHLYGLDEIPTKENQGYPLFRGFFQHDYLAYRRILFGEDCLSNLPEIDVLRESLDYISRLRRVIRQSVIDPKMSNTMARALLGLGTLDMEREINVENRANLCSFLRYSSSIASKAYLECSGEHYISKNKNVERIKEILPDLSSTIDFIKSSKKKPDLNPKDVIIYSIESLKLIDTIYSLIKGKRK
jgi:predicted nucleotidyltransferase